MRTLITFILLFSFGNTYAQDYAAYQKKYWDYRNRFLGTDGTAGFVSVGPDLGQSIPADGRNFESNCEKDWVMKTQCSTHPGRGKMNWGDATAFQGFYLGMLALEYANLAREGKISEFEATARELHYALSAVIRLDKGAEEKFGLVGEWDGFFLRDDIPVDFYKDPKAKDGLRFSSEDGNRVECVSSDYSCHKNRGPVNSDSGKFTSQDQVIGLFFGFSLIHKLVPDQFYQDSTQTFGKMVSDQTKKIMELCLRNKWKLRGPDGVKISNKWGGDFRGFNNLFQKTAVRLTNAASKKEYKNGSTRSIGWMARSTFDWAFWAQADRNHWLILSNVVSSGIWNNKKIAKRSLKSDRVMFALAYSVVNDVPLHEKIKREDLDKFLETAPPGGPCYGMLDCEAPPGWFSNNRWVYPNYAQAGNPYGIHMEWNGIDYMLFYNLYHYLYNQDMPAYVRGRVLD